MRTEQAGAGLRKRILSRGDEIFPRNKESFPEVRRIFFQEMMVSLVLEGSRALRTGWSVKLSSRSPAHKGRLLCRISKQGKENEAV